MTLGLSSSLPGAQGWFLFGGLGAPLFAIAFGRCFRHLLSKVKALIYSDVFRWRENGGRLFREKVSQKAFSKS